MIENDQFMAPTLENTDTAMDKDTRDMKTYAIRWTSPVSGKVATGTKRFNREEAEQLAAELNQQYPAIEHEVVLAGPLPEEPEAVAA